MTILSIDDTATVTTLVSTFDAEPEHQAQLVDLLTTNAAALPSKQDGFVSCSIHVRDDGTHVVNYAQRHDQDAIAAMMANPLIRRHVEQARLIATVHPEHYTVRLVCRAA